jgi:hypothetical protein
MFCSSDGIEHYLPGGLESLSAGAALPKSEVGVVELAGRMPTHAMVAVAYECPLDRRFGQSTAVLWTSVRVANDSRSGN